MNSYTVRQIADMLKTNEETVRRWIRSGKLVATQGSKKSGNVVTSAALNQFISETPKYAKAVAASLATSPFALSVVVGGLLGGLFSLMDENKAEAVTSTDVEDLLKRRISLHEKRLRTKKAAIQKLQAEIDDEQQNLDKYQYALENLDLELIATEINNGKK